MASGRDWPHPTKGADVYPLDSATRYNFNYRGPHIPSQYLLDSDSRHEVGNDGCNPKPGNPRTLSDTAELVDDDISDGYRDSVVGGVMLLLQHVRHIRPRNTVYDGLTMAASNSCATFLASVLNEIVSAAAVDRLDMICLVYASICPSN